MALPEHAQWQVDIWSARPGGRTTTTVVLQSGLGDPHDTALIIDGDFGDINTKVEYAKTIAEQLNGVPYTRSIRGLP